MKLVINCAPEHMAEAMALATAEMADFAKYTKVGWGWTFGPFENGRSRFFVRRLKDGLSVTGPKSESPPPHEPREMGAYTYETLGPRCPHCGHLHSADDPVYYDEKMRDLECDECGKVFAVEVYTSTSWTCRPLPKPEPEGEQGT